MFAVCVTFQIRTDAFDRFVALVRDNAKASLRDEPGCARFDVCICADRPGEVFLYEIYASPEAFAAHKAMPHYKAFDAAVKDMVTEKTVKTYSLE